MSEPRQAPEVWMRNVVATQSKTIERYIRKGDFFVNIGACDGVSNDPIWPFIEKFSLRGIAVEPIPHVFERLQKNLGGIPGILLERVAIAATAGEREFFHLPAEIDEQFEASQQIACDDKKRLLEVIGALQFMGVAGALDVAEKVVSTRVECITFDDLMERNGVDRIDFLNIDAEGGDVAIVRSIDFKRWSPRIICVESNGTDQRAREEILEILFGNDYSFITRYSPFSEVFVRAEDVRERLHASGRAAEEKARPARLAGRQFTAGLQDQTYKMLLASEADYWGSTQFEGEHLEELLPLVAKAWLNECLTGKPSRSWYDDAAGLGHRKKGCFLGSTSGFRETAWLSADPERELDVYDVSPAVLERAVVRTQSAGVGDRLHIFEVDLNARRIDRGPYDFVLACSCLDSLVGLEWALDEVSKALAPDGIFAFYEFVGERRLDYGARRLELIRKIQGAVPARYRWNKSANYKDHPLPKMLSPFQACRSDDVLPAIRDRFELIHLGAGCDALPGLLELDLQLLNREEPSHLMHVIELARAAEGTVGPLLAYGVARRDSHANK